MIRHFPAILLVSLASLSHAQTQDPATVLNFEAASQNGTPSGWSINPPGAARIDDAVLHGGKQSARIDRKADSAGQFSGILHVVPIDFSGGQIVVRAWLRSQDAAGPVALWARQDGAGGVLNFQTTQMENWKGTNDWRQFSLAMPLNPEARQLFFGVLINGTGTAWADDVQVLVDGKPFWEALKVERETTPVDADRQFDSGSGIALTQISDVQLANLVTLGKVWGFLKYHHPAITAGKRHWDYDLFRELPSVLAAQGRAAANSAMAKWIAGLGEVTPCKPCASLDEDDLALRPAIDWIKDRALLGSDLSDALQKIYTNRSVRDKQFYLSFPPLGNPKFEHEAAYPRMPAGDSGFQILAAYRFWNIVGVLVA